MPVTPSDSRGVGATETYEIRTYFQGDIMLVRVTEEAPRYHIDANSNHINCIVRAARTGNSNAAPLNMQGNQDIDRQPSHQHLGQLRKG